jgi:hypothetical protein
VYSDRIIAVKLKAEPVSILIVQVYMPTSEYEDDEVEELYDIIEEILEDDGKGARNMIIMGDWKSVVGDKAHQNTAGPYGHDKWVPVTTAWCVLRLRMEERPLDMEGGCENIEQTVADSRQGVVLQLGGWARC